MRIRNYRPGDNPALIDIQHRAALADVTGAISAASFEEWLAEPEIEATSNVFVLTDDDESNEWGQGGTLEGVEGQIIGYTVLWLRGDQQAYHFICEGAVHPGQRRRNGGRALLICALNRARIWATEFEFEAEEEGRPIYFEALLPLNDRASESLAAKCEMEATAEQAAAGMRLYRRQEL